MKERLTGAIILVALIVLLVPELLSGPPRAQPKKRPSAGEVAHTATGEPPVRSYTLPLGGPLAQRTAVPHTGSSQNAAAPAAAVQSHPAADAARASTQVPHPAPAATTSTPAVRKRPQAARKVTPQPPSRARPATRPKARARTKPQHHRRRSTGPSWVVQLGVFAVHADALRLAGRIRHHRIGVRVVPMRLHGRRFWRVVTPPVHARAVGLALAARLRRIGVTGELLRQ